MLPKKEGVEEEEEDRWEEERRGEGDDTER